MEMMKTTKTGAGAGVRRMICALLIALMVLCSLPADVFAAEGLGNFKATVSYTEGQFSDVKSTDWYANNVATAYRMGLLKGQSDRYFNVKGYVTLAESIAMAARLHSIYYTGSADFEQGKPWYQVYVDYALDNGIIAEEYADYNRNATRAEYAVILSRAVPESALAQINDIKDGAIPDVSSSVSYAPAVYELYRAGVLTGYTDGSYKPNSVIQRSEIAAIVTRIADKSLRKEFTIAPAKTVLTAEEIAAKCENAVFYIELYDEEGYAIQSGSGFFIDPSGIAVTNYHVIEGADSATIWLPDGKDYEVEGVYDYDIENDVALIKVRGSGFSTLDIGGTDSLKSGMTIYTLGSPLGFDNTFSQGMISNPKRLIEGITFIQITAPISHGSSGGALLDTAGRVIGVTSAGYDEGQNLNLAVPIERATELKRGKVSPLSDVLTRVAAAYPDVTLTASNGSVTVAGGSSATIDVTTNLDAELSFYYVIDDESVASAAWEDWKSSFTCPLTIYGLSAGSTDIRIYLFDSYDNKITSTTVKVTVTSGSVPVTGTHLYPAKDSVSIGAGASCDVRLTTDNADTQYVTYAIGDSAVVSAEWYRWEDDYNISLKLTGLKSGSTRVMIYAYDASDTLLASTYIDVSVTDSYYSGFSGVPDFGKYFGIALTSKTSDTFFYSVKAISASGKDSNTLLTDWFNLLTRNGFTYYTSFKDDSGYTVKCYRNTDLGYVVMTGVTRVNGVSGIMIRVYKE